MSLVLRLSKAVFHGRELARRLGQGLNMTSTKTAPAGALYDYDAKLNDGTPRKLSHYKGQVLLIVNTASECGFTPQYEGLRALQAKYKDRGLRVLAFPCNDFGAQERGTDAEILGFCRTRYGVEFDVFAKIAIKGPGMHPLYRFLTEESGYNGAIPWNFSKFLVARDGRIADRFGPEAEPLSASMVRKVEALLEEAR